MKKLIREPLLHFLVLGAVIFAAYGFVSRGRADAPGEIVVTRGKIENLATLFAGTWSRPPTDEEMQGMVHDYVREEAAYREALAQGLDRDDTIVRRRLRQKLEFLASDAAAGVEPTDADLQVYLDAHPQDFATEATLTFEHVYLDPRKHGVSIGDDAARLLAELGRAGADANVDAAGDPFLLEHRFESLPASEATRMFGAEFAAELSSLPLGQWQGPLTSGYGAHLVLVSARTEARTQQLDEVRAAVRRDWLAAKRTEANEAFYRKLLERYTVEVEPAEETKVAAAQ